MVRFGGRSKILEVSKKFVILLVLAWSLFLSFSIRIQNLPLLQDRYLLGTDAYRFLRQASIITSERKLPRVDKMRWYPVGRDLSTHLNLFSYAMAYAYRILRTIHRNLTIYRNYAAFEKA